MFNQILKWLAKENIPISETDCAYFKRITHAKRIAKNTIIQPDEEQTKKLFFLNTGIVRLFKSTGSSDVTIDFADFNTFLSGITYMHNAKTSPYGIETLTDVEVLYWEKDEIISALKELPIAPKIEKAILEFQLEWNQKRENTTLTHSPTERYLKLVEEHGDIIRSVPLKYIASYLGIHHDSLSRIRKQLSKSPTNSN